MVKIEININQLKQALQKLPVKDRAQLAEDLLRDHTIWRQQFRRLLSRVDARVKKSPLSQKEILETVEQARDEYYAKHRR